MRALPFAVIDVGRGVIREVIGIDTLLGLSVPVLQFVVHLELGFVVLEVLRRPG